MSGRAHCGPFPNTSPRGFCCQPSQRCSQEKVGEMAPYYSPFLPPENSVNDGIWVEDFPLRYSTVYDAINSVMLLGRGALMAKIDIKGVSSTSVQSTLLTALFLACTGKVSSSSIGFSPLASGQPPSSSTAW